MARNTNADQQTEHEQSSDIDTHPSLEDLVRGYLTERGKDNVAQVAVNREGFKGGLLIVTGHTSTHDELPEIITEADIITHHGYQYELHFEEDPYGPSTLGRITLYASDTIRGMDGVPLEDGLATVDDHMQELLNHEDAPRSRTLDVED